MKASGPTYRVETEDSNNLVPRAPLVRRPSELLRKGARKTVNSVAEVLYGNGTARDRIDERLFSAAGWWARDIPFEDETRRQ